MIQEQWANEMLCTAARAGCMPIVQRLMNKAQHEERLKAELLRATQREQRFPSFGRSLHQSIGEAVLGNHLELVQYLLGQTGTGAHLKFLNSRGENVLHLASDTCNPAMFRLLMPCFPEGIYQADEYGITALVRIIRSSASLHDRHESAKILLSQDDISGDKVTDVGQQHALQIAVRLGDLSMCRLLIDICNVDPLLTLTRTDDGQFMLKDETIENKDTRPSLLQLLSRDT